MLTHYNLGMMTLSNTPWTLGPANSPDQLTMQDFQDAGVTALELITAGSAVHGTNEYHHMGMSLSKGAAFLEKTKCPQEVG